ncbi:MAG: ASKHA domain-containing protein [Atribacterota bacterium]|nr:ASKHA domain-containing protein [Atribacterota bacterium]MDD4895810.1 ASKHA domain-containing protein [Atribacterota bacterium]MDD5637443.1 ASKHA domain-containing protein [Atribacterota bacterium]
MIKIIINPAQKKLNVPEGTLLLDVLKQAGINITTPCGGKGSCGKCKVIVSSEGLDSDLLNSNEQKWISEEEIKKGFRLACQCYLYQNSTIIIPPSLLIKEDDSKIKIRNKAKSRLFSHEIKSIVSIKKVFLRLNKPTLSDQRSYWNRIKDELNKVNTTYSQSWEIPTDILSNISQLLRDNDYCITLVLFKNKVIAIEAGDTSKELYGVAFDIGTTTIAGYLVDLATFREITAEACANPQFEYGDDVISRIDFARKDTKNRKKMQQELISSLNQMIISLSEKAGINLSHIYFAVLVGNTSMHHFLWSLPVENLALSPYITVMIDSIIRDSKDLPDLCLIPYAKVYSTPNVSAYIGGDIIADLIDIFIWQKIGNTLMVDLGTNGEIVLNSGGKTWACSAAAGPAFEGARISSGMRATSGAIDRVIITRQKVEYHVIGQTQAVGLCGSGIIDLIAGLLRLQLIKFDGRLINQKECTKDISQQIKRRIKREESANKFLLVPAEESATGKPIYLTQKDIREVQLAKGAVSAGIRILLKQAQLETVDIDEILLAGAFGNVLDTNSALSIGLIPNILSGKIRSIGNAAGEGAVKLLLSEEMRTIAEYLSQKVQYIELSAQADFLKIFAESMFFNHFI